MARPIISTDPLGAAIYINLRGESYDPKLDEAFWDAILKGFQEVIGDCATLKLNWRRLPIYDALKKRLSPPIIGAEITYDADSVRAGCKCDPCWQHLKRVIDSSSTVWINRWERTDNAKADWHSWYWHSYVYINEKANVTLWTYEPGDSIERPTTIPFSVLLWHEAIGHAGLGLSHPRRWDNVRGGGGSFYDPTIREENLARKCLRAQGIKAPDRVRQYWEKDFKGPYMPDRGAPDD